MTIKRVYMHTMPGTQYLFKNGKAAVFIAGRYETDVVDEIAELDAEIKTGIPYIYIDPKQKTVDTALQDFVRQRQVAAVSQAIKDFEAGKKDEAEKPIVDEDAEVENGPAPAPEPAPEVSLSTSAPTSSLATLLAARSANAAGGANTGIATTANVGDAAAGSSS